MDKKEFKVQKKAYKKAKRKAYGPWKFLSCISAPLAIIFIAIGVIDFPYIAIVAMGASLFLFLGTLIIGDYRARSELKRRFHI